MQFFARIHVQNEKKHSQIISHKIDSETNKVPINREFVNLEL